MKESEVSTSSYQSLGAETPSVMRRFVESFIEKRTTRAKVSISIGAIAAVSVAFYGNGTDDINPVRLVGTPANEVTAPTIPNGTPAVEYDADCEPIKDPSAIIEDSVPYTVSVLLPI